MAERWGPGGAQGQLWKEAAPGEQGSSPGSPWSLSKASEASGGEQANGAGWAILAGRAPQQPIWPPQGAPEAGSWAAGAAEAAAGGGSARSVGGSSGAASPTFADTARLHAVVQHQQQQLEAANYRASQAEERVGRLEQLAMHLASEQTVLQGQLEASRHDLQAAESRAASAAQSRAANPQLTQYLSVTLQQLQLVSGQKESAEGERDRLAAAHGRMIQTLERERDERERQAALAQQQIDEARREQRRLARLADDQARQLGQQHAQLQELQQELLLWQMGHMSFGGQEGSGGGEEPEEEEEEEEAAMPGPAAMWAAVQRLSAGCMPAPAVHGPPVPPPPPPPPPGGPRGPLFGMPMPVALVPPPPAPPPPPPARVPAQPPAERRGTQLRPTAKPFEPPVAAHPPASPAAAAGLSFPTAATTAAPTSAQAPASQLTLAPPPAAATGSEEEPAGALVGAPVAGSGSQPEMQEQAGAAAESAATAGETAEPPISGQLAE